MMLAAIVGRCSATGLTDSPRGPTDCDVSGDPLVTTSGAGVLADFPATEAGDSTALRAADSGP